MILEIKENGIIITTTTAKKSIPAGFGYWDIVDNDIILHYSEKQTFQIIYSEVTSVLDKTGAEVLPTLANANALYNYMQAEGVFFLTL